KEIYEAFDKIGCLSFTSVNERNEPESRIAHLRAYDEDGIYFMTMNTKAFYSQLKQNGNVAICGLAADSKITHDSQGRPLFNRGYSIQMTGKVEEISMDIIKAKKNPIFDFCIYDQEKYPAMIVFCIREARGNIFDYDFEKTTRENKLERRYFSYNGERLAYRGLTIDQEKCIGCGVCKTKCSFLAIKDENGRYKIDKHRCDECGDCYMNCPVGAIHR
ncbi:MAG: 4Fe-4S binding protein, partial [Eubacteriales bacterium]